METDHALTVGGELGEQGLARRRGPLGIVMVSGGHPVGIRERDNGVGEGITENHYAIAAGGKLDGYVTGRMAGRVEYAHPRRNILTGLEGLQLLFDPFKVSPRAGGKILTVFGNS